MDNVHVLHISPLLKIGGAEQKLLYILKKLDKNKFSHHVIYSISGELNKEIESEGISVIRFYPMSLINPLSLYTIWRIYRYIKKKRIDIVHCHLDVAYVLGGTAALLAGVPLILSFQNIADSKYFRHYKVYQYLDRVFSMFSDKVLVESEDVKTVLLSWGIQPEKLLIVFNGVEVRDDFYFSNKEDEAVKKELRAENCFLVGNMARLVDFKNHTLLLNAAAKVLQVKPDVKFVIIGDGPLRGELKDLSDALGINKDIIFLGTVMNFEYYLKSFDIFVLSSYTESTPMALLHALAFGRPVISTTVGDIPSFIQHDKNGILVPSDDPDALASAILNLLDDQNKRAAIAKAGWKLAKEKFSIQIMIDGIEDVYINVIKNRVAVGKVGLDK